MEKAGEESKICPANTSQFLLKLIEAASSTTLQPSDYSITLAMIMRPFADKIFAVVKSLVSSIKARLSKRIMYSYCPPFSRLIRVKFLLTILKRMIKSYSSLCFKRWATPESSELC